MIEEDGKTEEEFVETILSLQDELDELAKSGKSLQSIISENIGKITQ